LNLFFLD